jgi:adenylate cyclase
MIARSVDASGEVAGGQTGLVDMKVGPFTVPLTRTGEIWVRYTEPVPERTLSAAWVLEAPMGELAQAVQGMIVLVGTSAPGLRDLRATPLRPAEPGVEIHAQIVEQIVAGDYVQRPDWAVGVELLALVAGGAVVVLAAPFVGALWGAIVALAAAAGAVGGSWLVYAEGRLLLDPVAPMLAVVVAFLVASTAQFLFTERERTRVREAFGQYLSPTMVERLARDPESLRLGGEVRELTLLFLDLRGFTTMSERMTAQEVTHFLNDFLTPMTEAVMESGGTVDKYMGDAMMAFWNAPLDQADHSARACRAALDIRQRFAALRERLGQPALGIGIGLNRGPASVGNMGSRQRFDYSAIGDAVNSASRLEGLCKAYGLDLLAGEPVRAAAPDLAWLEIDRVRVVGKTEPMTVHTLLGDAYDTATRALVEAQAEALDAYRAQDWQAARLAFSTASLKAPNWLQPLYTMYGRRIELLQAEPPGPDWDGVFVAESK